MDYCLLFALCYLCKLNQPHNDIQYTGKSNAA